MSGTCPVLTPEDARGTAVIVKVQRAMLDKIAAAITEAYDAMVAEIGHDSPDRPLPPRDYFAAVAHHSLFLGLCKADPETSKGGRPGTAAAILQNFQGLAKTWEVCDVVQSPCEPDCRHGGVS